MSHSSKLIEPENGVMETSNLHPNQKEIVVTWGLLLTMSSEVEEAVCGIEPLTCGEYDALSKMLVSKLG